MRHGESMYERCLPSPTAVPASSVVVFRRAPAGGPPQLLLLERASHMRFAADAAVFPGGRIDPADHELAASLGHTAIDPQDAAARVASVRETLEEAGLALAVKQTVTADEVRSARTYLQETGSLAPVLERFGWTLELDQLVPFARWCPHWDRAFDTHFYIADIGTGAVSVEVDGTENKRLFWASAADALAQGERGEIQLIYPTARNLERLARFPDFSAAQEDAVAIPIITITPWMEDRDGFPHLTIPEGLGYPVTSQRIDRVRRS